MVESGRLTGTSLLAGATEVLLAESLGQSKYSLVAEDLKGDWPTPNVRLFEDNYGIVAIVVYETWAELLSGWTDAQEALVELMSHHMNRGDAKAWDGYLVLLTPGSLPPESWSAAVQIRNDTRRVRKLLATGNEIESLSDIMHLLLPLLPLELGPGVTQVEDALAMLPESLSRLSTGNISRDAVQALVDAFNQQRPLVEALDKVRTKDENSGA